MARAAAIGMALLGAVAVAEYGRAECAPDKKAPKFDARVINETSRIAKSSELFAGKTTILSFFATWCRPCKEEIPELRALMTRYSDRGFQVVLISLDRDQKDAETFLRVAGAGSLLALWDEDRKIKDLYKVVQLPTNVRIDPDGCIGASWFGYLPEKLRDLEQHLKRLPQTTR